MHLSEKQRLLSEHLARFRTWSYAALAERIERDGQDHDCLDYAEGVSADGTAWQIELNVFWDDRRGGDVRVTADLITTPRRPLLGFLPIYTSDATDSFLLSPDGRFIGEDEPTDESSLRP